MDANDNAGEKKAETTSAPSDASSQTQESETSQRLSTFQQPSAPQPPLEEDSPTALQRWKGRGKSALVWAWKLFVELVAIVWLVALWDSYRPKITIAPGGTFDAKNPFATYFILQNQGSLAISHVTYQSHLTLVGMTNQAEFTCWEKNASVVGQMKSLESYSLGIRYAQIDLNIHNPLQTTNEVKPSPSQTKTSTTTNTMQVAEFILAFDVSYKPRFFGKRTDTLCFFGLPDADGNWQWLPSAHEDINQQTIDTNLITQAQMNPVPVATQTNGSSQVHVK